MELAELARRERPLLQALIEEEMRKLEVLWGRPVDRREPEVSDQLCRAVLERGGQMRKRALWGEPLASRKA